MIIGSGAFDGRNGYLLQGTFTFTRQGANSVLFETSDDFFFGTEDGRGTPAPGFALFRGDPTGLSTAVVSPIALATDFLRISDQAIAVSGRQSERIGSAVSVSDFDTLFLWCFRFPMVLGVGAIVGA